MKAREFWNQNRWGLVSGIAYLVVFALIVGISSYMIAGKFTSLNDQITQLSASVASLESSSPAMKISLDGTLQRMEGISQKLDDRTMDSTNEAVLENRLNDMLKELTDLSQRIEALRNSVDAESQAEKATQAMVAKLAQETLSIPEVQIAGGAPKAENEPASDDHSKTEPIAENEDKSTDKQPVEMIAAGQPFTVLVQAKEVSDLYGYQFNLKYENQKATYQGSLKSSVSGINTIFKKDMPDHLLVGATMVGDLPGYTGEDVTVCSLAFVATEDVNPDTFVIDGVNTVDSKQTYMEDIDSWSVLLKAK